jgi:hypothetical protein
MVLASNGYGGKVMVVVLASNSHGLREQWLCC